MNLLIEGLDCSYGKRQVLFLDRLELSKGESLCIVGQNGSGKSTLLRSICGLHKSLSGKVLHNGQNILTLDLNARSKLVSMMLQTQSLDPGIRVKELVELGRTPYLGLSGRLSKMDNKVVEEALADCDLLHVEQKRLFEISGGELQRARLALTLAQQAKVLLLDEPVNHLDHAHRYFLYKLIKRIKKDRGNIVIMVFHSIEDARRFAKRILLIDEGRATEFSSDNLPHLKGNIVQKINIPENWVY